MILACATVPLDQKQKNTYPYGPGGTWECYHSPTIQNSPRQINIQVGIYQHARRGQSVQESGNQKGRWRQATQKIYKFATRVL